MNAIDPSTPAIQTRLIDDPGALNGAARLGRRIVVLLLAAVGVCVGLLVAGVHPVVAAPPLAACLAALGGAAATLEPRLGAGTRGARAGAAARYWRGVGSACRAWM